jgi:hypothetical protein
VHASPAGTVGCGDGGAGATHAPQLGSCAKALDAAKQAANSGSATATALAAALRDFEPCSRLEAALRWTAGEIFFMSYS